MENLSEFQVKSVTRPANISGNQRVIGRPFPPGVSGNPAGRPADTPEQKIIKKATKQIIKEYQESLAAALPDISPVLVAKAIDGDIQAIKELHDRAMGKPVQRNELSGPEGTPLNIPDEKQALANAAILKYLDGKK